MAKFVNIAIKRLDADLDENGDYLYQEIPGGEIYVVTESDLSDLGRRLDRGDIDAYSRWCAETITCVRK